MSDGNGTVAAPATEMEMDSGQARMQKTRELERVLRGHEYIRLPWTTPTTSFLLEPPLWSEAAAFNAP